ncbi:MAG: hypothetical protein WCG95_09080 [bacterium]
MEAIEGCLIWIIFIGFALWFYSVTQNMFFTFLASVVFWATYLKCIPDKPKSLDKEELEECLEKMKNDNTGTSNIVNEMTKCPYCQEEIITGAQKCKHCGEWLNSKPHTQTISHKDDIPVEIRGWNWGAFFLTWIWGIGNKSYLSLWAFIPYFNFIWGFVCGAKGNEWAWKNKKWTNVEEFNKAQKKWVIVAVWVYGVVAFLTILIYCYAFN